MKDQKLIRRFADRLNTTYDRSLGARVKEPRAFELVSCEILVARVSVKALIGLKERHKARVGSSSDGVAPGVTDAL